MKLLLLSSLFAQLFCLGTAQFEPPPTTADPSTIKDCTWWFIAGASDTCDGIAAAYGIAQAQLVSYNPVLASSCTFVSGASYCVEQNFGIPVSVPPATPSPTPTTFVTSSKASSAGPISSPKPSSVIVPTSTSPGNGVETPQPTQPGMLTNCNKFHYVAKGVTCSQIISYQKITLADFALWNPTVLSDCSGMWAEVNVCVGIIGGAPTTSVKPTTKTPTPTVSSTTSAGNGVATPQPTQPNMVLNCNKFHWVAKGVTCSQIISYQKITLADFAKWNPSVGTDCAGMWAEVNVCVGVIGGGSTTTAPPTTTTTKPTTTTSAGNGVQTPQPTQPGMVTNCKKFHYVADGVTCSQIISYQKITLADFVKWNTGVGSNCQTMWAGTNVCVGV